MKFGEFQSSKPKKEDTLSPDERYLLKMENREKADEEERRKIQEKLSELRKMDIASRAFSNNENINYNLKGLSYFEKLIAIEQGMKSKKVSFGDIAYLLQRTDDNGIKMAIIENLPNYRDSKDSEKAMETMRNFFINFSISKGGYEFKEGEEIAKWRLDDLYKTDWDAQEEADLMRSAIIDNLAKFGPEAEEYLLDLFLHNRKRTPKQAGEDENENPPRQSDWKLEKGDPDESDFYEDGAGFLSFSEDKSLVDDYYLYNKRIFRNLSKIASDKSIKKIADLIIEDPLVMFIYRDELASVFERLGEEKLVKIFIDELSSGRIKSHSIYDMTFLLSDVIGSELFRTELNKLIEKNKAEKDKLAWARSLFTPNHDKVAIENLKKFYEEKIKFEDYGLNKEMNEKETELLKSLIGKNEKVLEMGCGTGRLLLEMEKAGYDLTGFDFSDHIKRIKEENPEAKVFEGDWHQTGLRDESFDAVYSLGRNILHDYSIVDQVQMFREANRILKKGGKFIFDIPDREKGSYKMMVEEYAREMEARGIKNFRFGSIYDSPDGVNFATRYAYSKEDIEKLAQLTGFIIKEVREEDLKTGMGDKNLYYVLEKV